MDEQSRQMRPVGGRRAEAAGTYWHGWFWEAEVLVLTDLAETEVLHRHVAVQVVVSLGGPTAMRLADGSWQQGLGTVVASDVAHVYDSRSEPTLGLWIDPASTVGRAIAERYLTDASLVMLDDERCARIGASAPHGPERSLTPATARTVFEHAVEQLIGDLRPRAPLDPRVAQVLRRLDGATHLPPVAGLASAVGLSASRLQHLVREHLGVSLSRWLMWRRTLIALERMLEGASATEAAYHAGFADGAEFTRRFREFFAAAPTAAVQDPRIRATVCSRLPRQAA
ncbi:MAG: helix-turn-helix domain-containing protein [Acidimicrobiales bacterium]